MISRATRGVETVHTETVDERNRNGAFLPSLKVGNHVRQEDRHGGPDTGTPECDEGVSGQRRQLVDRVKMDWWNYLTAAFLTVAQMTKETALHAVAATIWYAFWFVRSAFHPIASEITMATT